MYTSGVIIGHQSNRLDAKEQDFNSTAQGGWKEKGDHNTSIVALIPWLRPSVNYKSFMHWIQNE